MRIYQILLAITSNGLTIFGQTITVTAPTTFCDGGSVLLTAPSGSAYQWQNNGSSIPSATTRTYTAITSGSYTVTVTISGVPKTTPAVVVTVNPNPVPSYLLVLLLSAWKNLLKIIS